jgi:hypothetical protein
MKVNVTLSVKMPIYLLKEILCPLEHCPNLFFLLLRTLLTPPAFAQPPWLLHILLKHLDLHL